MPAGMRRRRRESIGPIGRYLEDMRRYALLATLRAEEEAHLFARTGQHQEIDAFFHVRNDERTTSLRLAQYEGQLRAARLAGRYKGGTMLRRVLPDGTTEPWAEPEPADASPDPALAVPPEVTTAPHGAPPAAAEEPRAVTPIQRLRLTAIRLIGRLVA